MEELELIIKNQNKRVYISDYGVPTIQLGDGGTTISDIAAEDGFHGICFSEAVENNGVGADMTDQIGGMKVDEIGAYLQILTKNPESLQILIDKCILARDALIN